MFILAISSIFWKISFGWTSNPNRICPSLYPRNDKYFNINMKWVRAKVVSTRLNIPPSDNWVFIQSESEKKFL